MCYMYVLDFVCDLVDINTVVVSELGIITVPALNKKKIAAITLFNTKVTSVYSMTGLVGLYICTVKILNYWGSLSQVHMVIFMH